MGPISQSTIRTSFVLGIRLLIQASTLLLVARLLGPDDFGLFAGIAALAVLIGTFSTFGTHLVLLGEVSKDHAQCTHVLRYAIPTTLIVGSLLFFLYVFICLLFFHSLGVSLTVIICIGLTEIILLPLFLLSTTEELALEKTAQSQLLTIFPLALRTLAIVIILLVNYAEPLILFAWLYFISALLALVCRKIYKPNAWLKARQWRLANKQDLKNSAGYAALALTAAGPSELDKILAIKLMPLGMSGLYIGASRIIGATVLPVMALLLSTLPRFFRESLLISVESHRLLKWIFITVICYSLILTIIIWYMAPLVEMLFGLEYKGLGNILKWICLAVPALSIRIIVANLFMTLSKPWLRAGFEVFGTVILIFFSIFSVEYFETNSIVFAVISAEWAMAIIGVFILLKYKNNNLNI